MGEVVQFARRLEPEDVSDTPQDLIEVEHIFTLGEVRLVTAYRPGEGETGPYHLLLRAPGVPDWSPVSVERGAGTQEQLVETMRGYAHAMWLTLNYARLHPSSVIVRDATPPGVA